MHREISEAERESLRRDARRANLMATGHDGELIAASAALLAAAAAFEADAYGEGEWEELGKAMAWVNAVLNDRPAPVGTSPSPEYAPREG